MEAAPGAHPGAQPVLGRDAELRVIDDLLDGIRQGGSALLLRGEPGIGKSALLAAAQRRARARDLTVLNAVGVQSEMHLPFAGLHQLLLPLLGRADALPSHGRDALLAAFGLRDAPAPDFFRLALTVLELLARAAAVTPVVLTADDVHWLDRSSWEVLAFVARRVEPEPIVMLATSREPDDEHLVEAGLPELLLRPLADEDARNVVDRRAPDLSPAIRERLLAEAAGNPLALVELPIASRRLGAGASPPVWLPLTARLEGAFMLRIGELPALTRQVLLTAALDDRGSLAEVLEASRIVAGVEVSHDDLLPAISARLVDVDERGVRMRHPLVRSALHQAATLAERHAVHTAFAELLAADPDRAVWHRAAASVGPDERVASDLEDAATRAIRRSGVDAAVGALERAAALSEDPRACGRRLLDAAELAFQLGRREVVLRLLEQAETLELDESDRERITWNRELFDGGPPGDAAGVRALTAAGERAGHADDMGRASDLLRRAAMKCWGSHLEEAQEALVAAIDRLGGPERDPRLILVAALAAPEQRGAQVIELLSLLPFDAGGDAELARLLGNAAGAVGDDERAIGFLTVGAGRLEAEGRFGLLVAALAQRAWSYVYTGRLDLAQADAEAAVRLADATGQPVWASRAASAGALVAGLRGQRDIGATRSAAAERVALPTGSGTPLADVETVRAVTSLSAGDHGDAYTRLARLYDPADPIFHSVKRWWVIGELVEAALHTGRQEEARGFLAELEPIAARVPSPRLHAGMGYARAVLADDEHAERLFRAALEVGRPRPALAHARLRLAFGAWLRRRRRVAESRAELSAAREAFAAIGAVPWEDRVRDELRAAGVAVRRHRPDERDELTEHELRIARMAAAGMSNREIGEKLLLSHRTVSSHLYRVFPKLGITSRGQLREALERDSTEPT